MIESTIYCQDSRTNLEEYQEIKKSVIKEEGDENDEEEESSEDSEYDDYYEEEKGDYGYNSKGFAVRFMLLKRFRK